MSLKNKTNITFIAALITLAIVGWFSIQGNRRTEEKDHLVSHGRDVIEASEQLRSHIYDASVARRAYTLWGDAAQIDAFNLASKAALADFATLYKLTADNAQRQISLAQMEPLIKARLTLLKASVELHQKTRDDIKQQELFNDQSTKMATEITDLVDKFARTERGLLQEQLVAAQASDQREATINIFLGLSIFLFLIFTLGLLNRELSRREQAERSAAEQKELLQSILDSCSDAVIVANTSGKIILRNPVGVRYNAGAPADELSANYPELLGLFKADRETLFRTEELPLSRALKGSSEVGLEICVRPSKDSAPRWMLAAGGPLLNVRGEQRGGVVFLRDITDRKKADEQLKLALLESEALAKESGELSELGDSLQSCLTIEEIYSMSERMLPGILDFRPGKLSIINSSRDLVESVASWENCSTSEAIFHPDDCWALRRGKIYGLNSPLPCPHVSESVAMNYLCVPLIAHGETLGILYLEDMANLKSHSLQAMNFEQTTINRLANAVAERISFALANLKLRELLRNQSIRDPLTGLFNRRYLEESLNRELNRANRTDRIVSVVMLDLDHFKHFNDTFGHQVGDILLKEVAVVIKSRVRAGDLACRYGGEEFSLILAEVDAEGAYKCVESIRESIKHLSLHHRGQTLGTITVSAGVATFPAHGNNSEDLIRCADEALYRAKKSGRDCIIVYEPLESKSTLDGKTI
ncbi:MAG TPA: diguanylate cyclase [Candidatus Acidoferrales bacterium]|nr:diguanylate cyclase [Candidatus Acidoferrales bacterium]